MEVLRQRFLQKLDLTPTKYVRYLHNSIEWGAQLIAILGARGVGKSTMVLQHIKLYEDISTTLYISADDIYLSSHTLVELAHNLHLNGGKALYIDDREISTFLAI